MKLNKSLFKLNDNSITAVLDMHYIIGLGKIEQDS